MTGALAGVKVLDLSRVLAGPYATQILGDHGADVIKVEPPSGDETREWGPPFRDANGPLDRRANPSAYYLNINRNKQGIALDLTKPDARDVVLKLLETSDVLVENFKIGTMGKWGLGYEEVLSKRFPRLVYARISGFGAEGPLGGMPGYDAVIQTQSGLSSANGSPESGPVKLGVPIVDMVTGLNLVIGVLLALRARDATGQGQMIDMALWDCAISILHPHSANWLWGERLPKLLGNAHPSLAPYDLFQTRTRPVFLGVGNDTQFRKACEVLGCPDLARNTDYINVAGRNLNRTYLTKALAPFFADKDGTDLALALLEAGVPAGTLNTVQEVLSDPQTMARDLLLESGGYKGVASPIKLSQNTSALRHLPPGFGADNASVLQAHGYSDADIESLRVSKALHEAPKP
jgi:crotonobetainyl-CoA:carnitine CoA-transferase CaiB-like acyl-CoA transferase